MLSSGFDPKPTILVVDGCPETCAQLKASLAEGGFETVVASDGGKALGLLEALLPDLVLFDANVKGADPFEVCRRLKAAPRTHALPFIFVSSQADRETLVRAFAAGAVDFISKPIHGEELCARVAVHTANSRALRELEESRARLAELNAEKDQMFGVAAHDLRGPLTAILGFVDHALNAPGHPEAALERHALEVVRREARQLNHHLEQLLDLNAIERGGVRMRPRVLDLREMVRAAVERHIPAATRKEIDLRKEAAGALRLPVRADPNFLRQILDNYLSNALKFTPIGGCVGVRVADNNGEAHFTVRDSGPGLKGDDMAHAFKRFALLSARPTAGEKSTGLGLAICRALATRMGGRVWCGNQPGGGACFGFALPLVAADEPLSSSEDGSVPPFPPAARQATVWPFAGLNAPGGTQASAGREPENRP